MKTTLSLALLAFTTVVGSFGCADTNEGTGGGCPSTSTGMDGSNGVPAGVSPVIYAEVVRIARAADPTEGATYQMTLAGFSTEIAGTAASDAVETKRAHFAADNLVRTYVSAWVDAAGIPAASWKDTLPATELTPEQVSFESERAFWLIRDARIALGPQTWDADLDTIGATTHAAIMGNVPGLPGDWYGTDAAFRCGFETTGILGAKAGSTSAQDALNIAFQAVGPTVTAAAAQAVTAMVAITTP